MLNIFRKTTKSISSNPSVPYSEALNYIASNIVGPMLKKYGYKKHGLTFIKHYNDNISAIINLQAFSYNNAESSIFFINLGLYNPTMYNLTYGAPIPDYPKEYHASSRWRIEQISKRAKSEYEYRPNSDIYLIGVEAAQHIETYAVPFFENNHSLESLIMHCEYANPSPQRYKVLAIYNHMKDNADYKKYLVEGYSYCINKGYLNLAREIYELAGNLSCSIEIPELVGETEYAFRFELNKKLTPTGDIRKSVNRMLRILKDMERNKLGYVCYADPKVDALTSQTRFFTREPEQFEKKIRGRLKRVPVHPSILKNHKNYDC